MIGLGVTGFLSLPVRGAWIEIDDRKCLFAVLASLPVRGAWIEMFGICENKKLSPVAPRAGSVD